MPKNDRWLMSIFFTICDFWSTRNVLVNVCHHHHHLCLLSLVSHSLGGMYKAILNYIASRKFWISSEFLKHLSESLNTYYLSKSLHYNFQRITYNIKRFTNNIVAFHEVFILKKRTGKSVTGFEFTNFRTNVSLPC